MRLGGYYTTEVEILVPGGMPEWLARELRISPALAKRLIKQAIHDSAQIVTKVAVIDPDAPLLSSDMRKVVFCERWAKPMEGQRWYEFYAGPRTMQNGAIVDIEMRAKRREGT